MPKFMIQGSYTREGLAGLMREGGSGRKAAVAQLCEQAGGKVDALYWALGEHDVFAIVDLPDAEAATSISMAVNASGAAQVRMTRLLTVEEVDKAAKRTVDYRAPGN